MRADLRPLVGIEKALEQRAEDRRVDQAPVEARGGEQEADFVVLKRQRRPAVEQAAVEFENVLEIEVAALRHVVEQAGRDTPSTCSGLRSAACSSFFHRPFGQQLHAVGEEAEDELVDEMRDRLSVGITVLQPVGDRLELVGRLLGQLVARAARAQLFRIVKDSAKVGEVDRVGEVLEFELVHRRRLHWSSASRCGRYACRRRHAAAGFPARRHSGSAVRAPCRDRASSSCIPRRTGASYPISRRYSDSDYADYGITTGLRRLRCMDYGGLR